MVMMIIIMIMIIVIISNTTFFCADSHIVNGRCYDSITIYLLSPPYGLRSLLGMDYFRKNERDRKRWVGHVDMRLQYPPMVSRQSTH